MKNLHSVGVACAYFMYFVSSPAIAITQVNLTFDNMNPIEIDVGGFEATETFHIDVTNNTGIDWTDFHLELIVPIQSDPPIAMTNQQLSPLTQGVNVSSQQLGPDMAWFFLDAPESAGVIIELGISNEFGLSDATLSLAPSAVPIPPALWLFGSGLLGLVGIARRKKAA